jgi:tetratricopeptide (TPR) repeat protein
MGRFAWATCLWPGLALLWERGSWPALGLACAYGLAIDLLLAATLVWHELLAPAALAAGWLLVLAVWLGSAWFTCRALRTAPPVEDGDLFPAALDEYLRGNWYEAEERIRRMLTRAPQDVEAALLLAGVLRRSRRFDEARRHLRRTAQWDAAEPWRMEIDAELALLEQDDARVDEQPDGTHDRERSIRLPHAA